jgi:hypothetical protein
VTPPVRPSTLLLLALVLAWGPSCNERVVGPTMVPPARPDHPRELFVVIGSGPGRSFRIRYGGEEPPQRLAAYGTTFYDGTSLIGFDRSTRFRVEDLAGGGTFTQSRTRLRENDLLGSGHWEHARGRFRQVDPALGADCDPSEDSCDWQDASGAEIVSVVGTLRGVRTWARGTTDGEREHARASYTMHDRFGDEHDLLHLYGPAHRELIAAARQRWDAIPPHERACHAFDYKSSILRPAPGGLVWVMHGTATSPDCAGTTLAVEVPAPLPQYGSIELASYGDPGEVFHLEHAGATLEPGVQTKVTLGGRSLALPGTAPGDPPLVALYATDAGAIPEAHRRPLEFAFSEVHDLALQPAATTTVDGQLDDWTGAELLLLDQPTNVIWGGATTWDGADDAALAVGVRQTPDGWVVAARLIDDVFAPRTETPAAGDGDHLELWLRTADDWAALAIRPTATAGAAEVTLVTRSNHDVWPLTDGTSSPFDGVEAAWSPRMADGIYQGMDLEVAIESTALERVEGGVGMTVVFADADDPERPGLQCRVGTAPWMVDAWVGAL